MEWIDAIIREGDETHIRTRSDDGETKVYRNVDLKGFKRSGVPGESKDHFLIYAGATESIRERDRNQLIRIEEQVT